jgi:hypothetical protein
MNGGTPAVASREGLPKLQQQKKDKRAERKSTKQDAYHPPLIAACQPITLSVHPVRAVYRLSSRISTRNAFIAVAKASRCVRYHCLAFFPSARRSSGFIASTRSI